MIRNGRSIFTSESVSEGHPDKVCDYISDAILDAYLAQDCQSRVACETFATTETVIVGGEISSTGQVDIEPLVRSLVSHIGYDYPNSGFESDKLRVEVLVKEQSADIALGVNAESNLYGDQGAGDQGMVFGYACRETAEFMPAPIIFSHRLLEKAAELRKMGSLSFLRPDAKAQVTVSYEDGQAVGIETVVLSHQHEDEIEHAELTKILQREVIEAVLEPTGMLSKRTKFLINPTGRFVTGGPAGDTGLTGRKIVVDTYGGMARHGGGAFSGKDPSKVDRSGAYMARYVAKNLVAWELCDRCEIQISYAIGYPQPVSILVETFGTGKLSDRELEKLVIKEFDFRPAQIIKELNLLQPIYKNYVNYGHFGKESAPWEALRQLSAL